MWLKWCLFTRLSPDWCQIFISAPTDDHVHHLFSGHCWSSCCKRKLNVWDSFPRIPSWKSFSLPRLWRLCLSCIVWDPTRLYWCLDNVWVLDQNDHDHLCFIMTWKLNPCACWSRVWTFLRFGFWRRHKLMHQVLKTRSCLVRICFHRYLFMLGRSKLWYHHAHGVNFTSVQDNAITLLHSHSKDYCLWWTSKIILWRRRWALRDSVRR